MSLYTASYHDAELYLSWIYVALFTLSGILQGIRQPSLIVICAAGHFKETVGRACLEFAVNLSFSLFLVSQYDIAGVLIGTCAAFLYRSADSILYNRKHFIPGSLRMTVRRLLRNTAVSACILVMGFLLLPSKVSLFLWIIEACLLGTLALLMFVGTNYIFEKETFMCFSFRLRSLFSSKEK